MELTDNQKLLNAIYQNLGIAIQSIDNLMPIAKDRKIEKELAREYSDYNVYLKECEMLAKAESFDLKGNSFFDKAKLWTSIKLTTITDKSCQHISEMMIIGTNMGIIDLVKANANLKKSDGDTRELANKLEKFERQNIETLFEYLKDPC